MKQKLLIIKLGGAVVTFKDSPKPKTRTGVIKNLAKEIKQVSNQGYQLILVHGAGSFAHGLVKKYGIDKGMKTNEQKKAFIKTQQRMLKLNKIILDHLIQAGINPISLTPHEFVTQTVGKLKEFNDQRIIAALKKEQTPLLFGDMVLDDKWGCSVLSGDTIVCYLAKLLKADKVIFLSDVDGIFDSDPRKNPQAKLIPEINNSNIDQVLKGLSPTGRDDVTGEMSGKILQIKNNLKGILVWIINGLKVGNLLKVLDQSQIGTKLQME